MTFRVGLFGLEKLHNAQRSVAHLAAALDALGITEPEAVAAEPTRRNHPVRARPRPLGWGPCASNGRRSPWQRVWRTRRATTRLSCVCGLGWSVSGHRAAMLHLRQSMHRPTVAEAGAAGEDRTHFRIDAPATLTRFGVREI